MKTLKLIRTARHHICMIYEQGKHFVCLGDKWITIYRALEKIHPITQSEVMEITIDLQFTCKVEPKLSVFNKYR